jgi:hypothetical protein
LWDGVHGHRLYFTQIGGRKPKRRSTMSILSTLFRKKEQRVKSYIRAWAESRQHEFLGSSEIVSPANLFELMMLFASSFLGKEMRDNIPSELNGTILDISEHYSGDATLFELGCYMYFRLDLWLYQKRPHRREEVSTIFTNGFIELFTHVFGTIDVLSLFNQRISGYAELVRAGKDEEACRFNLDQLVVRTRDNRTPEPYDFQHEPLTIISFFEHMALKIVLAAWENDAIPRLLKFIDIYCVSTE